MDLAATDTPIETPIEAGLDQAPLAVRFAAGEPSAFESVVAEFSPRLAQLTHRLLGWQADSHEVDDIVQETFVAALRRRSSFRGDSSLWTWLAAIAINVTRSRLRKRQSWRRWFGLNQYEPAADRSDHATIRDETTQRVRDAVQQLKAADREVIVLYYLQEQPVAEIASVLKLSRNAVDVRLHRARQRLTVLLEGIQ